MICLCLVLATLAVYWQVLQHDFVNFDDDLYVTDNRRVQGGLTLEGIRWAFTTFHASNWHPLTWLSHMLDCQVYEMDPGRHHLTNLLFHIANTVLLFFVFRNMTGGLWQSAFVAALFALHPLHVESVAWVSERKDVLSTFFWVLTMSSYVWYAGRPAVHRYLWVVVFFTLGLMSKPMLVTVPFVLLLLDFYPLNRFMLQPSSGSASSQQRPTALRLIGEKIPLFVLAALSVAMTIHAQKQGGAVASLEVIPFGARAANALVSYATYIGKMLYPAKLAVFYPYPEKLPVWKIAGACLLLLSISFMAIRAIKHAPYLIVGWLWYLGTLVPVIGLVQVGGQAMADRYTYVPLIGLFVMIAWGVSELMARWRLRKIWLSASAAVLLTLLAATTWKQAGYWKNSLSLYQHAIEATSRNAVLHNNLGYVLAGQGLLDDAIRHYQEALRIKPGYAKARNNMGDVLARQGLLDEAIRYYRETLRIKPEYAEAHNSLGITLLKQGKLDEAIRHFQKALQIKPDLALVHNNLGMAYVEQGRFDEAIEQYQYVLKSQPDNAVVYLNIGNALTAQGRLDEAVEHYQKALGKKPGYALAHKNLGIVLIRKGDIKAAVDHFNWALQLTPNDGELRQILHQASRLQQQ
ncbi:MAG: tetratricopeptide repeat protein [Thermodesulfobacteriota bacterium]